MGSILHSIDNEYTIHRRRLCQRGFHMDNLYHDGTTAVIDLLWAALFALLFVGVGQLAQLIS